MLDHADKLTQQLCEALKPHGIVGYFKPSQDTTKLQVVFKRDAVAVEVVVLDDPCDPTPYSVFGCDARWPEVIDVVLSGFTRPAA